MKTIILFILCLIATVTHAQCEYEQNGIDEFKGYRVVKTKFKILEMKIFTSESIKLARIDSSYLLYFKYVSAGAFSVNPGNELIFKLLNSEIVTIQCLDYTLSDFSVSGSSTIYYAEIPYAITKSDLKKLSESGLAKVRFYTNDGYIDVEIKAKKSDVLSGLVSCILNS